jgi:CBS-domain-containing membrane protein
MILHQLLAINIILVVFNMLPAFPMDGGRVLRALLAMKMEYTRATQIAATIGQGFAVLFGLAGLFSGNFLLLFVALFVWMGAEGEASLVRMRSALAGIPIQRAMQTEFRIVPPEARLGDVLAAIAAGYQRDFPVLDNSSRLVGVLTRDNIMQALAERNFDGSVADVMETDFVTAHPREMLQSVLSRCEAAQCHVVPVVDHGRLVGLVSADRLGEFLMLDAALRSHRHA